MVLEPLPGRDVRYRIDGIQALLEETGHMPSEKYAHGPEILAHCHRIGRQYQLYENALFHTQVTDARWDESRGCWLSRPIATIVLRRSTLNSVRATARAEVARDTGD